MKFQSTKFYAQMIERSMHLLPTVYEKAEQLMMKVETCDAIFVVCSLKWNLLVYSFRIG